MLTVQQPAPLIYELILNRPEKHNAFNAELIQEMRLQLQALAADPQCQTLILRAHGASFCAGADLEWMKSMLNFSYAENVQDAEQLAGLLGDLNEFPVPTIAAVQGPAYGGGVGLIACCDIAFASPNAKFCFSEVKLGLTPSTIAPFVIRAIGERTARRYFLTAEVFSAEKAQQFNLINEIVDEAQLQESALNLAKTLVQSSDSAKRACKKLIRSLASTPEELISSFTANHIATQRISEEAQQRLGAFLCSKKS